MESVEIKGSNFDISTRSKLYNLQPMGLGTPYGESLNSYLGRLAFRHNVTMRNFVKYILTPEMSESKFNQNSDLFFRRVDGMSSFGVVSRDSVRALERLTNRKDLEYLTLIKWKKVFPTPNIFDKHLKWCPDCLCEQEEKLKFYYEPLIWSIKQVELCCKHKMPLVQICRHCKKKNERIAGNYIPGFCSNCSYWLGEKRSAYSDVREVDEFKLYSVKELGKMISRNPLKETHLAQLNLEERINLVIKEVANGNVSEFSRMIGVKQSTVSHWHIGNSLPSTEKLLWMCYKLNISLIDLTGEEMKVNDIKKNASDLKKQSKEWNISRSDISVEPKTEAFLEATKQELKKIIDDKEHPPPSLSALKKMFNDSRLTVHFPIETAIINDNYQKYRKQRKKEREENILAVIQQLEKIVSDLHKEKKEIKREEVVKRLDKPGLFRIPRVQHAWKKLKDELL